jgi:hypothetical protein
MEATTFLYQEVRAKVGSLFGGPPIAEPYEACPPEQGVYVVRATPSRRDAAESARVARITPPRGIRGG